MRPLLLLFIVVPIIEMWLLITVGREIGALPTIGLVLLTAVVGLAMLRHQGLSTVMRAQQKMQAGELPAREMAEGIFLAVGGALLLTPGFFTDALGFACLVPGLRQLVLGRLLHRVIVMRPQGPFGANGPHGPHGPQAGPYRRPGDDDIIEGDYSRDDSPHSRNGRGDRDRIE